MGRWGTSLEFIAIVFVKHEVAESRSEILMEMKRKGKETIGRR